MNKVPINRESLPVLRRVLSGALMAWLLQVHDVRWMISGPRRYSLARSEQLRDALAAGFIRPGRASRGPVGRPRP